MEQTVKERLVQYLEFKNIGRNKFEAAAGISYGYISNLKYAPSATILEKIFKAAPDLDREWLLTGNGSMLRENAVPSGCMCARSDTKELHIIPLLPLSAQGGSLNDFVSSIKDGDCERIVSPICGADYAITVNGDSMMPEYPSGSKILIKRIDEKLFIDWGHVHVLDTRNGVIVKQLFPTDNPEVIICRSINPGYPPFEVSLSDVYGVYRVLMCMILK